MEDVDNVGNTTCLLSSSKCVLLREAYHSALATQLHYCMHNLHLIGLPLIPAKSGVGGNELTPNLHACWPVLLQNKRLQGPQSVHA